MGYGSSSLEKRIKENIKDYRSHNAHDTFISIKYSFVKV